MLGRGDLLSMPSVGLISLRDKCEWRGGEGVSQPVNNHYTTELSPDGKEMGDEEGGHL